MRAGKKTHLPIIICFFLSSHGLLHHLWPSQLPFPALGSCDLDTSAGLLLGDPSHARLQAGSWRFLAKWFLVF